MKCRRLSFTERRRARLALKFARMDRLETRNTITEPISVTGLALSSMRGLVQLGIMQADGGNSGLLALTQAAHQAKQVLTRAPHAPAVSNEFAPIAISFPAKHVAGGGGSAQGPMIQVPAAGRSQPIDVLALVSSTGSASADPHGISTPWHPAARTGGGAALAPRGGSGRGAQAATAALVGGHGRHAAAPQLAGPAAAIPGLPGESASTHGTGDERSGRECDSQRSSRRSASGERPGFEPASHRHHS